ncbi:MAG: sigma-54-dependent Fis family transcriptional regulator [Deltaproteobacteria bacterium]|nr:sigma-54-dependent Fis family transcriptional regulator [Deltaproteobacteria bacterium]
MEDPEKILPSLNILVVDDEPTIRKVLTMALEAEGHQVTAVSNAKDASIEANRRYFDLALVDLRLGAESGMDLITVFRAACPWMKSVIITAYASIDTAVEAMRRGAFDYLPKPFTHDQVVVLVRKVARIRTLEQKVETLQEALSQAAPEAELSSRSPAMLRVLAMARQVADSEATILIHGESGTGKSILARAMHSWSLRASKPFCTISCPSLSVELLESELFGHKRGAFTGAVNNYPGRIASCQGGTLFLDEIGDLPLAVQAKLLRLLQEKSYERLGDMETHKADVRIIAATNVDLEAAVRTKRFREDLFYRLNVVEILIPPLRDRREDILPLAGHLLAFFTKQNHRSTLGFTEEASSALSGYHWPGNVRELRNAVERAVLLCNDEYLDVGYLPLKLAPVAASSPNLGDPISLEEVEEMHIRRILASAKSIEEACRILGMDSVTLWRRRKKYGI